MSDILPNSQIHIFPVSWAPQFCHNRHRISICTLRTVGVILLLSANTISGLSRVEFVMHGYHFAVLSVSATQQGFIATPFVSLFMLLRQDMSHSRLHAPAIITWEGYREYGLLRIKDWLTWVEIPSDLGCGCAKWSLRIGHSNVTR